MIDENEYKEATGTLIERVIKTFSEFNEIIKKNHCSLNREAKFEYLHFLLFLLVDNFQKWNLENKYLDLFIKDVYRNFILKRMVSDKDELRDFEIKSRERWPYYYNFIGEKKYIQIEYNEKLTQLIAREAMYLEKLISNKDETSNISFEILMHLQSEVLMGLILQQSLLMDLLCKRMK